MGVRSGVTGICEQRIEIFVKIQKKKWGSGGYGLGGGWVGGGGGVGVIRVDVTEKLTFCENSKKNCGGRFGGGGGSGWEGVRVDVNEKLKFL